MEILEKVDFGDVDFHCKRCHTTTRAKSGEYWQGKDHIVKDHEQPTLLRRLLFNAIREFIPAWSFEIVCPVCRNYVVIEKPTGEPSTFASAPSADAWG